MQALAIRKAVDTENFHEFFQLYCKLPSLGKCILNLKLNSWRVQFLQRIVKAFRPQVELNFVLKELLLPLNEEGVAFLKTCGVVFIVPQDGAHVGSSIATTEINTKDTQLDTATVLTQESNLL
jgi:hypothetical protein